MDDDCGGCCGFGDDEDDGFVVVVVEDFAPFSPFKSPPPVPPPSPLRKMFNLDDDVVAGVDDWAGWGCWRPFVGSKEL